MHIVSHKAIRAFGEKHPAARSALDRWYRVAKRAVWASFAEVKETFGSADFVAPFVVFDIGGNKYRLVAELNYTRRVLFIRHILTHMQYSKGDWKQ
jgi:mRNA interferase HigB